MITPSSLSNFSASDSLNIAKALGNKTIDKEMAKNLGAKIPKDTDVKDVLSLASAIPLEIFNKASASDLVDNLNQMDTTNMDPFRKNFIANKVIINSLFYFLEQNKILIFNILDY